MSNRRIYKYPIQYDATGASYIMVPPGSRFLSCGLQNNIVMFWMDVDAEDKVRTFVNAIVKWTGDTVPDPDSYRHVATLETSNRLIAHVFIDKSVTV